MRLDDHHYGDRYKRSLDPSWLPRITNREGVKGRMIGPNSQMLQTNSISPEIQIPVFSNTGGDFSHNLRNPGDRESTLDAIKQICFQQNHVQTTEGMEQKNFV